MMTTINREIRLILIAFTILLPLASGGQNRLVGMGEGHDSIPFATIEAKGLMVMDINTVDQEWPSADYVWAPGDAWGLSLTNVTHVPGRLVLTENGRQLYDSGDYVENSKGMTVSLRGNSSAHYPKKPYKIKLQSKADLLCRNNANYRDTQWVLICDESFKAFQGLELSRLLGMTWVPGYRYVNLVINNEYCGVYMLVESIKRNTNCRINIKKDGFIFESDAYWWNEDFYIPSYCGMPLHFTFKYPDLEDMTEAKIEYMTNLLHDYEFSLFEGNYPDYIDVPSFARWTLGQDILSTYDAAGINRYYIKNDMTDNSKIVMPVMWDFDSSECDTANWSQSHILLMYPLFESTNRAFVNEFVDQWEAVAPTLYQHMSEVIYAYRESPQGVALTASMPLDNTRWNHTRPIYSFYASRAEWFNVRYNWLDRNIKALIPRGDLNRDGIVDVADLNLMINMILCNDSSNLSRTDLNSDDKVDISDVNELINIILTNNPIEPDDPVEPDNPQPADSINTNAHRI